MVSEEDIDVLIARHMEVVVAFHIERWEVEAIWPESVGIGQFVERVFEAGETVLIHSPASVISFRTEHLKEEDRKDHHVTKKEVERPQGLFELIFNCYGTRNSYWSCFTLK